jgi:hypothetical protein
MENPVSKYKKIWFKAKEYGYGWYPIAWEGWGTLAVFATVLFLLIYFLDIYPHTINNVILFVGGVILSVLVLLLVCYTRGEKLEWRWGKGSR